MGEEEGYIKMQCFTNRLPKQGSCHFKLEHLHQQPHTLVHIMPTSPQPLSLPFNLQSGQPRLVAKKRVYLAHLDTPPVRDGQVIICHYCLP